VEDGKFVATYEQGGRTVAALIMKWPAKMAAYQKLIAQASGSANGSPGSSGVDPGS